MEDEDVDAYFAKHDIQSVVSDILCLGQKAPFDAGDPPKRPAAQIGTGRHSISFLGQLTLLRPKQCSGLIAITMERRL